MINNFSSVQMAAFEVMDSAADRAYQNMNSAIDMAEQNIGENIGAQEKFNAIVQKGSAAFDGILGKLGGIAEKLHLGDAVKNAAEMTYTSAVELEATEAKYQTVFSGMTGAADQFIGEFQKLTPVTTAQARTMASSLSEMLVPMGLQREEATQMTGGYMQLIGALSNYNSATMTAQDVSGAFQSAIAGDYGALKGLGIQIDDTTVNQKAMEMGLASSTDAVTSAARAQALLALSSEQSGSALSQYNSDSLDTTTRMQLMQTSIKDAFAQAGQAALPAIGDLFAQVQANMPLITAGISGFVEMFTAFVGIAADCFSLLMSVGGAIAANWQWIAPVIAGVTGAMIAYNIVQTIGNTLQSIAAITAGIHAIATQGETIATFAATAAQSGFNTALLACPLTWIVIAIIAVIAAIAAWIYYMGGIEIACMTAVDAILTKFDALYLGFNEACMNIQIGTNYAALGFAVMKAAVLICLGQMKADGLMLLQSFVNGTIDGINKLINTVNQITGAALPTITWVAEFGTNAVVEEAEKARRRVSDLASMAQETVEENNGLRSKHASEERQIAAAQMQRRADIAAKENAADKSAAEKAAEENTALSAVEANAAGIPAEETLPPYGGGISGSGIPAGGFAGGGTSGGSGSGAIAQNTGNTAANTASMAGSMDMAEEDLKSMRDMAEQEIINRFTTAALTVNMGGITNQVNSNLDLDGIGQYLDEVIFETLSTAAEGVY